MSKLLLPSQAGTQIIITNLKKRAFALSPFPPQPINRIDAGASVLGLILLGAVGDSIYQAMSDTFTGEISQPAEAVFRRAVGHGAITTDATSRSLLPHVDTRLVAICDVACLWTLENYGVEAITVIARVVSDLSTDENNVTNYGAFALAATLQNEALSLR